MSHNLADLLRARASEHPDTVAVHFPAPKRGQAPPRWTPLTFGQIDRQADDYARGFVAAGIQPGDRTLLMARPSEDFYPLVFGLFRAGAVPVFIDPGMGLRNALACVQQIAPRAMVAIPPVHLVKLFWRAPFRSIQIPITAGRSWGWSGPTLAGCRRPGDGPFQGPEVSLDDDAVIVFTSGSTGPAKGVSMTHRCMRARVGYIQQMLGLTPGDTISETLLVYSVLEICMGLTVVIPPMNLSKPATVDPADVVATIRHFDPQVGSASPVVWHRTVRHAQAAGVRLPSIRMLLTTAAPIPVDLHARLGDVFEPGVELMTPYGATEAMPIARIGTAEILRDASALTAQGGGTCVGAPAPGIEIRILSLTDAPIPTWDPSLVLPQGAIGEITVRGAGVSDAYRNSDEGNAQAKISDGQTTWHRMGDLGYLDASGRLWFCGRKTHRLETEQGMLPAVCVEGIFNQHPDVFRSALVGVGPLGHQRPVLCVELEEGRAFTPELVQALLKLADGTPYADRVTHILHHPRFPTDARHNSKIRREDLRAWAERQGALTR